MSSPIFAFIPLIPVIMIPTLIVLIGVGLWRAFHREHYYLLTGFSGSGKTELVCALSDLIKNGSHINHSCGPTINNDSKPKKLAAKQIWVADGGGTYEHSQYRKPVYQAFLKEAMGAWIDKYTILFLVDMSKFNSTEDGVAKWKVAAKSELDFLTNLAKEKLGEKDPSESKRLRLIVVGTHKDKVDAMKLDSVEADLFGVVRTWIDACIFNVNVISADLYSNDGAKCFAEQLFGREGMK